MCVDTTQCICYGPEQTLGYKTLKCSHILNISYHDEKLRLNDLCSSLQVVLGPLIAIGLKISNIHERTGRRGPNVIT